MALSNEERIRELEKLLARVESRRGGAEEAEHESEPDVIDLADSDDVIELSDDDEVTIEDEPTLEAGEEEVPMIPEEFEETAPQIEVSAEPAGPIELEPVAPAEPGPVAEEAAAARSVEPIDVSLPPMPEIAPVVPEEPVDTTLELHPTTPRKRELPATQALPVIPEPVMPEPARPAGKVSEPPPTKPEPVVPELAPPAPLPREEIEARPDIAHARPAAFQGSVPRERPRTIGGLLRAALRVGSR